MCRRIRHFIKSVRSGLPRFIEKAVEQAAKLNYDGFFGGH